MLLLFEIKGYLSLSSKHDLALVNTCFWLSEILCNASLQLAPEESRISRARSDGKSQSGESSGAGRAIDCSCHALSDQNSPLHPKQLAQISERLSFLQAQTGATFSIARELRLLGRT